MKKITGFTLLELVIVLIIIGILAAVAVPRITTGTATARANRAAYTIALYSQAIRQARLTGITDAAIMTAVTSGQQILDTTILVNTNSDGMWTYTYASPLITATKNEDPQANNTITYDIDTATWGGTYTPLPSS